MKALGRKGVESVGLTALGPDQIQVTDDILNSVEEFGSMQVYECIPCWALGGGEQKIAVY